MDLFRDINKGKFGKSVALKEEAKHELGELGGYKKAETFEKSLEKKRGWGFHPQKKDNVGVELRYPVA